MTVSTENTIPAPVIPHATPKSKSYFRVLLLIFLILGLGGSTYILLKFYQNAQYEISILHTQLNTFKQQLLETQQQSHRNLILQQHLQKHVSNVNQALQAALQQNLYKTNDWLLLKARYYLELAQINRQWSHDVSTTIALLQQADALLAQAHLQPMNAIRENISKEINLLQKQPHLNLSQLLQIIDGLHDQSLALVLKPVVPEPKSNDSLTKPLPTAWHQRLKQSAHLLEKLVIIRHHDETISPLPSPAYEMMLRENIRLNLQEVQWALLQNNEAVYQTMLQQIIKNIHRYFAINPNCEKMLQQLKSLQQVRFAQQSDIPIQSLTLLNALIDNQDHQNGMQQGEKSS